MSFSIKSRNIPSWYTELEYITGDGSSYIDTSFKTTPATSIDATIIMPTTVPTANKFIFSSRTSASYCNINCNQVSNTSNVNIEIGDGAYNNAKTYTSVTTKTAGAEVNIVITGNAGTSTSTLVKIDNSYIANTHTGTFDYNDTSSKYSLLLFACRSGSTSADSRMFTGSIKSFKVWSDTDVLVLDLVPCRRSDGLIGMYDKVNENFLVNRGSGTFIEGPEVQDYVAEITIPYNNSTADVLKIIDKNRVIWTKNYVSSVEGVDNYLYNQALINGVNWSFSQGSNNEAAIPSTGADLIIPRPNIGNGWSTRYIARYSAYDDINNGYLYIMASGSTTTRYYSASAVTAIPVKVPTDATSLSMYVNFTYGTYKSSGAAITIALYEAGTPWLYTDSSVTAPTGLIAYGRTQIYDGTKTVSLTIPSSAKGNAYYVGITCCGLGDTTKVLQVKKVYFS